MADFPTFEDLFRVARDEMLARNGRLSAEMVAREGTDANLLVAAGAAIGDELTGQLVQVVSFNFLDSADGEALDRLVYDRYGLVRKPATGSVGSVTFQTTAPAPAAFVVPAGTQLGTTDGLQYVTTAPATFPRGGTGPVWAPVRSVQAGLGQRSKIGAISVLQGSVSGAPADLTVTNPLATAGSADAESDSALRERARAFFSTARRGTLSAIEQGALVVSGVDRARAFEVTDASGRPARYVLLAIADSYTDLLASLGGPSPTYARQSQILGRTVFNALYDVRAAGIYVEVQVAQTVLAAVRLALSFQPDANPDVVAVRARAVVVTYINTLKPGQALDPRELLPLLQTVPGLFYTGSEVASPAGPIVPNMLQVIRTTLALVLASSSQSSQPLSDTSNPDALLGS